MRRRIGNILWIGTVCIAGLCACGENRASSASSEATIASTPPVAETVKRISWDIVATFPHDPSAFTEGLEFHDGFLYESTGEYGKSELRKVDPATGKVAQSVKLENQFFGEGITIIGDKIYQLTYREGKGFIYDRATLKKTGRFAIHTAEGWGMTNNGSQLIFDDGSNLLHFLETTGFNEVKTLSVTDENGRLNELNELEMINGFVYANVWKQDMIVKIDTATGRVVARADLSELRGRIGIPAGATHRGEPEVMNGIAFDSKANKIYITGKNWPRLIELKLDN